MLDTVYVGDNFKMLVIDASHAESSSNTVLVTVVRKYLGLQKLGISGNFAIFLAITIPKGLYLLRFFSELFHEHRRI